MAFGSSIIRNNLLFYPPRGVTITHDCPEALNNQGTWCIWSKNPLSPVVFDASGTATLEFHFSQAVTVYGFVIPFHDLGPGLEPTVQASTTETFSILNVNQQFTGIVAGKNAYCILTSPATYAHWRILAIGAASQSFGGLFVMGAAQYTNPRNYNWNNTIQDIDTSESSARMDGGPLVLGSNQLIDVEKRRITFSQILTEQRDELREAAKKKYCFLNLNGSDIAEAPYTVITDSTQAEKNNGRWDVSLTVEQYIL